MMEQEITIKSIKGCERPIIIECGDVFLRISVVEAKAMVKGLKAEIKFVE